MGSSLPVDAPAPDRVVDGANDSADLDGRAEPTPSAAADDSLTLARPAPPRAPSPPSAPTQPSATPATSTTAGSTRRRARPTFDDFYGSNYGTVVRLAYSLCGSMAIAEELAQEAFVSAHSRWRRISRFDRPDLWVRRVVINRSISFRRRQANERSALERSALTRRPDAVLDVVDDEVLRALRSLSARQAEVLALVYLEDRPLAEVAEILRLGPETVKTHLKRGRSALAARIAADRGDTPGHAVDAAHPLPDRAERSMGTP